MTAPSRREWRVEQENKKGKVLVQTMKAFGWTVHRHIIPTGGKLVTKSTKVIPRSNAANLTLYVRGVATLTHEDGTVYPDRIAGMFSGDRPDTPKGVLTHSVIEELEFWCFNWHANKGKLPVVNIFRINEGEIFSFPSQTLTLLCSGTLGSIEFGTAFIHDGSDLTASGDCYGFILGDAYV